MPSSGAVFAGLGGGEAGPLHLAMEQLADFGLETEQLPPLPLPPPLPPTPSQRLREADTEYHPGLDSQPPPPPPSPPSSSPPPAGAHLQAAVGVSEAAAAIAGDDHHHQQQQQQQQNPPPLVSSVLSLLEAEEEQLQLQQLRKKSVNMTECVPVPSSEHVAEIVGRQGCKIKALRAKTNTYIKTPVRGEEPVFVVTGRKEDVAMAKREIISAAEHFSMIRAARNKSGVLPGAAPGLAGLALPGTPSLPGQTTIQVRVPYRVVGLVVGPKGATIKRIQQQTHTYIVTPSRDKEPVFEVTGMPENVDRAREEIEAHIAVRTGNYIEVNEENDFHSNGTDVSFDSAGLEAAWAEMNANGSARNRLLSSYRNDSSSSLGSGSTDSYLANRMADFSPTSPFSATGFWFGESVPTVSSEEMPFDSLPTGPPQPVIWCPFEQAGFSGEPAMCGGGSAAGNSQPTTPRLSPTFLESVEQLPLACRPCSDPLRLFGYISGFSNGNSYSSSSDGSYSASGSPTDSSGSGPGPRGKRDCMVCFESEVIAALVPCGHNRFCMECANRICGNEQPKCPMCNMLVTQAIRIYC